MALRERIERQLGALMLSNLELLEIAQPPAAPPQAEKEKPMPLSATDPRHRVSATFKPLVITADGVELVRVGEDSTVTVNAEAPESAWETVAKDPKWGPVALAFRGGKPAAATPESGGSETGGAGAA